MIKVSIYRDENKKVIGFHCVGHAGYAESGSDIICAAVSALTMTTINSIDTFTADTYSYDEDESTGMMDFRIISEVSGASELLLNSLLLGLCGIEESYGKKYIRVDGK